ncbi:MAG: response regulator [Rubrivivax sp.]|nr:response regulator [Rubrivivax sp.]
MSARPRLGPAALVGLSAVVLTALIGYKSWREHQTALNIARAQTQSFASALEEQSRQTLHRVAGTLRQADDVLAQLRALNVTDAAEAGRRLAALLPADRLIHAFAVLDAGGRVRVSTNTVPREAAAAGGVLPDYHAPHARGADREVVFGAPRQLSPQGDWLLPMSRRITLPGGAWDGVIVAWVRPHYLQGFYDTLIGGQDGIVALFLTSGWAAVTSPLDDAAMRRNWSDAALFREHMPQWPTGTVRGPTSHDQMDRIYSYRVLNEYPVVVTFGLSSDAVLAGWRRSAAWDGLLLALALAVLGGGAWTLARREQGRQEAERAQAQMHAAQEASHAKTEFLARMSHELRTPLNAVLGFAQLLEDHARSWPQEPRQHLRLLHEGAQHLQALVSDVMDVASIEAGRLDVARRPVPVVQVVESSVAMCAGAAVAAGVRLQTRLPSTPPEGNTITVTADATRLRQVLANLVSNGIKYNHPGGQVVVTAVRIGERVRIEVEDDGLGMTDEQQRQLFTPYDRLGREGGTARGTGIGLVLVRQLVTLMSGSLEIRSEADRGTRVTIELPFGGEALEPAILPSPLATGPQGIGLVLYIEDEPVNRLLVQETLRSCPGVELLLAETGHEGLSLARERRPGLVLLDMQLPDLDGPQVLAALRSDPATRHIPVAVLSASAMSTDIARAQAAGAVAYWTKPIDVSALRAQVQRLLAPAEV